MNTKLLSVLLLCCSIQALGQADFGAGMLPHWDYGIKLNNQWKINGKLEGRINSFGTDSTGSISSDWGVELFDFQSGVSYKTRPNQAINFSFLLRYRNSGFLYRAIQQYSLLKSYETFSLGQRFRLDQTFGSNGMDEMRARYRLTFLVPLSGHEINAKEAYFKCNNEYLIGINESIEFENEIRLIPAIGYAFKDENKLELGIDYRFRNFLLFENRHQLWLSLGWYYTF